MVKVFIIGSEGTTGLRLKSRLAGRSDVELLEISSELRKDSSEIKRIMEKADYAFLCLPDAAAREISELAEDLPVRILDTSTVHRTDPGWAYGFPELSEQHYADIKGAKRVAVPGCHASGFIALVYPLIEAGVLDKDCRLNCVSLTGYSGGGKKLIAEYESIGRSGTLFSPKLYSMDQNHKHLPEMTAQCSLLSEPIFMPIVDDFYAGMLVTVPLHAHQLRGQISPEELRQIYEKHYAGRGLVRVPGDSQTALYTNALAGRDDMEIFVGGSDGRLLVSSRFDNLGKGASGAAIECFNIMCGLPEGTGLSLSHTAV